MIQARIHSGRIEVQEPIPKEWEGQLVKILPLTPDDAFPDLDERLAALQKLGPMELDADERDCIEKELGELDRLGRADLQNLAGSQP